MESNSFIWLEPSVSECYEAEDVEFNMASIPVSNCLQNHSKSQKENFVQLDLDKERVNIELIFRSHIVQGT